MNRKVLGYALIVIGSAGFAIGTAFSIKMQREQRAYALYVTKETEANLYAYKTLMEKASRGAYHNSTEEDIQNDYKFHQITFHLED